MGKGAKMTFEEWWHKNMPDLVSGGEETDRAIARAAWEAATKAEREACRQECLQVLQVLDESNNIAASVCAGRIEMRSD